MSETYQGDPSNVETLSATISGVTAGPNSSVTTAAPHGFSTGDPVFISGVIGIAGVNNSFTGWLGAAWTITVTGTSNFQINNGSTTGAWSSGGTAVDAALNPPITIPQDGDSLTAASVNAAFQRVADQLQFLALAGSVAGVAIFAADGTFDVPPGALQGDVIAWGGGGGGAGGISASQHSGPPVTTVPSGGGGAGAPLTITRIPLAPMATYIVIVGAGGAGGAAGGNPGADGGTTRLSLASGPILVVEAPGGAGAPANTASLALSDDGSTPAGICMPGGSGGSGTTVPTRWATRATATSAAVGSDAINAAPREVGAGGSVIVEVNTGFAGELDGGLDGFNGPFGPDFSPGGTAGTTGIGSTTGPYIAPGGTGGGGGGGAPGGAGGNGGNGGNGVAGGSSTGGNATAGTAAAANTGAGGGGGGSGGAGATPGVSHAGGAGGSGLMMILWQTSNEVL